MLTFNKFRFIKFSKLSLPIYFAGSSFLWKGIIGISIKSLFIGIIKGNPIKVGDDDISANYVRALTETSNYNFKTPFNTGLLKSIKIQILIAAMSGKSEIKFEADISKQEILALQERNFNVELKSNELIVRW